MEATMQISTKSLSVLVLVLLAAACGSASDPDSMPAANGGGVMQGTVMGGGSQNMRVAVPSSSAATTTDTAGGFLLTSVPKGAAALQFSGGGQSATLATAAMVPGEFRRMTVSISGGSVTEHHEQTETEFEGTVDAIDGMVLTVAGRKVAVTDATEIRKDDAAATLADLTVGTPVEVEGTLNADGTVTASEIRVEDRNEVDRGAVQADKSINATRIRVLQREGGDEHEEMHVTGKVTAVGTDNFTIGDTVITVDARTEFEGSGFHGLADLKVGDFAFAEVIKQADGSLLAEEVKKFTPTM